MSSLWERLRDKERRDGYAESQFDIEFPFQVGKLMAARGLSIDDLVEKGVPRAEMEGDKDYSRETMHKLAAIFDVALLVTFVPFSEMVQREESLNLGDFSVTSFKEDREPETIWTGSIAIRTLLNRADVSQNYTWTNYPAEAFSHRVAWATSASTSRLVSSMFNTSVSDVLEHAQIGATSHHEQFNEF